MSEKIVALIPARGGSKGIPKKNILPLGDHPLIAYSIAIARMSKHIDEVIVTTDSEEIADISRKYGASTPFLRPAEIARDHSTDMEFFMHYLDFLDARNQEIPQQLVHLRPTSPLREVEVVDAAIWYMKDHPEASSLRSMEETTATPYKLFRLEGEYARPFMTYEGEREFYNLPRQKFEATYDPNGHVDIVRPDIIRNTGMLHGETMKLWITEPIADIDTIHNYDHAKQILHEERFRPLRQFLEKYA